MPKFTNFGIIAANQTHTVKRKDDRIMLVRAIECSAIVTTIGAVLILLVVNLGIAMLDSSLKEIITGKFLVTFFRNLSKINGEGVKLAIVCWVFMFLLFLIPAYDTVVKCDREKRGLCICRCKACQKMHDAFAAAKTNAVARAQQN